MSFRTIIKKSLITLGLIFFLGAATPLSLTAHAYSWDEFESDFNDIFSTEGQEIDFTNFEGQLAQLSPDGYDSALVASTDLKDYIKRIVNFALGFLGFIAVLIVIYGGVLYVTAAGEEEKTQKGKKAIGYAAIGLIIVMGSFAFVNTIIKGGTGEGDFASGGAKVSAVSKGGFNASAEQLRIYAVEIFNGFKFLSETTEELKNIRNDAQKESLTPSNLPSKSSIISFLTTTESKLNNLKVRVKPFSDAEGKISNLLREIDRDIDKINNSGSKIYIKKPDSGDANLEKCDIDEEEVAVLDINQSDEEICAEGGYKYVYYEDLYTDWKDMHEKYAVAIRDGKNFYNDLITIIKDDYKTQLEDIFLNIERVYASFEDISAIAQGDGGNAHSQLQTNFGYSFVREGKSVTATGAFLSLVSSWDINANVASAGDYMMKGLFNLSVLYRALSELQFVNVRLTANVTEGPAPLTVIFDTVGSLDPAGGSIKGDSNKIIWDLGGNCTLAGLMSLGSNSGNDKDCDPSSNPDISCDFSGTDVGTTAKRCTFEKPGTYRAAVKISSNEPNKYAPGIAIITIKVRPPTTKINLKIRPTDGIDIDIMKYGSDDTILTSEKSVQITTKNATEIVFDATQTQASGYKWDFGDGTITDFTPSATGTHTYSQPGKYKVTLEVVNDLGVSDRKIFTLEIASIAARIKVQPENAFVNNPVTFDGSLSKSDLGKIVNYEWTIKPNQALFDALKRPEDQKMKNDLQKIYGDFKESGSNLRTLNHTFKYPFKYHIDLKVTDNSSKKEFAEDKIEDFIVKSKPPVAVFDFEIPKSNQPNVIYFDGTKSYDPDGLNNFNYEWEITPNTGLEFPDGISHDLKSAKPIVKFNEKGDYLVKLKVTDSSAPDEFHETEKNIHIENTLGVEWGEQKSTSQLNDDGEAPAEFVIKTDNAVAYEIDFGDGESASDEITSSETKIPYTYNQTGRFLVQVTVYAEDEEENSIERKFLVGGGTKPIANAKLFINSEEVFDFSKPIELSKKDVIEFDAVDSRNTDGTGQNLNYAWDFGNTKTSSKRRSTTNYKELSPKDPGYYVIKLKVSDKDDPSKTDEDEIQISIVNKPPNFSSIEAVPQSFQGELITPVIVNLKVFGAEDPDGDITKYKWWYFDEDDPEEPLGLQITDVPTAQLVIGTRGKEGQEVTYGFGLELTDSDSITYSNEEAIDDDNYSSISVVNGANAAPVVKFSATPTSVFVGDKVTFTSASTDSDGKIKYYYWDVDGDGFYNDESSAEPSLQHVYTKKNKEGYGVRLKVIDDKGGESTSGEPIKIYVDSLAKPPNAAFTHQVIQGSEGMKIKFTNNSTADEAAGAELISYKWDFDADSTLATADTDGDGKRDNDVDSQAKDPERLFIEHYNYKVRLTVTDNQGNTDEVVNTVNIPLANPPVAAFTYTINGKEVVFKNNSTADSKAGTVVKDYFWDFDTASNLPNVDSDGDGAKDNDKDSEDKEPKHTYTTPGIYRVKLLIVDNQGNHDEVVNEVNVAFPTEQPTGQPDDDNNDGSGSDTSDNSTNNLKAVLKPTPIPSEDGSVYLDGTNNNSVRFDFSASQGAISYYIIDKNIYVDSNGNGIKTDDEDFKTSLPGTWKTNFDKSIGKTVLKLTVRDLYGNENSTTTEIKFK